MADFLDEDLVQRRLDVLELRQRDAACGESRQRLLHILFGRQVQGPRIAGALGFAVTGGLVITAILQFWFGSLTGSYWANAGVIALSIAATSLTLLGPESLLGYAGLGIGAVVMRPLPVHGSNLRSRGGRGRRARGP